MNLRLAPALIAGFVGVQARAAPDEIALGKAEGYPLCAPSLTIPERCLVGLVSRRDEISPARKVSRGATVRELKRAEAEPPMRYRYQGETGGIDEYLARNRTTGLLILKDDTILAERYQYDRNASHRMTSMSMAKTIVAMLVGVAMAEGKIRSLDDRAEKYVPELAGTAYGATSLLHLLTMSSGIRFSEVYSGADDVATLVRLSILGESEGGAATLQPFAERERPAGERFHYASGDTQVLGLVVRGATGKTLSEYLSEKIWQPMGAEADASWLIDKGGYETAFTGFNATLRDYARFGQLLANGGAVDGRQLIPAKWVLAATIPTARAFPGGSFGGYGFQTWVLAGHEHFALRGIRNQLIFVDPRTKVVMVHTAAGRVGEPVGDLLALWYRVSEAVARPR
jgi:CubicO group peptidase (beta-lactamase class C family)